MKKFRLIRSRPESAVYNMALDAQIFSRYLSDGIPVLRVYRWQMPAFTYGVSQDPESALDLARCASAGVGIAKRITGGGVLFHDDEITYSFVCGKQDVGEPEGAFVSYREICAFLLRFYDSLGLKASFALEAENFSKKNTGHQLCSASYEKYDLMVNGKKIGGNAQKRRRQAVFQHGSIPCAINWEVMRRYLHHLPEEVPEEVTTLSAELAVVPDKDVLEQKLIEAFRNTFNVDFNEEDEALYEAAMVE